MFNDSIKVHVNVQPSTHTLAIKLPLAIKLNQTEFFLYRYSIDGLTSVCVCVCVIRVTRSRCCCRERTVCIWPVETRLRLTARRTRARRGTAAALCTGRQRPPLSLRVSALYWATSTGRWFRYMITRSQLNHKIKLFHLRVWKMLYFPPLCRFTAHI